jgi:uncharacterized protein CbrC (UPF0167 family)
MARAKQTKGTCAFCGHEIAKGSVAKHFSTCVSWQDALTMAEGSKQKTEALYHLRIQAQGLAPYWLNLEMRGSATLKKLDDYLREIWLECCGHLSQFSYGGWGGQEIPNAGTIAKALEYQDELTHIYDFGTESVTLIKMVGMREGKPITSHPITLLVRNVPPVYECQECQQAAAWLCMECVIEDEASGTLCEHHAENHPHEEYGELIPLVNSPRVGLCGYDGPAEPPY